MAYKRKKPYNKVKEKHLKGILIHLKKVDELRTNNRKENTM